MPGTKFAPIPCIRCEAAFPPSSTGEDAGSTATIYTFGLCFFNARATPQTVPPVPTPATNTATSPSVSCQISSPVDRAWTSVFAGFSNCCRMTEPGIDFFSSSALAMEPAIPFCPLVKTIWAPNAFNRLRRSRLMVSGMVSIRRYPLIVATIASPTPVLPLVGSMIVAPGCSTPLSSASSIIESATRSFTLPAGLNDSSLATIFS